jgi:hypothetical protein
MLIFKILNEAIFYSEVSISVSFTLRNTIGGYRKMKIEKEIFSHFPYRNLSRHHKGHKKDGRPLQFSLQPFESLSFCESSGTLYIEDEYFRR